MFRIVVQAFEIKIFFFLGSVKMFRKIIKKYSLEGDGDGDGDEDGVKKGEKGVSWVEESCCHWVEFKSQHK